VVSGVRGEGMRPTNTSQADDFVVVGHASFTL
jgi:hypothetical protein